MMLTSGSLLAVAVGIAGSYRSVRCQGLLLLFFKLALIVVLEFDNISDPAVAPASNDRGAIDPLKPHRPCAPLGAVKSPRLKNNHPYSATNPISHAVGRDRSESIV